MTQLRKKPEQNSYALKRFNSFAKKGLMWSFGSIKNIIIVLKQEGYNQNNGFTVKK